MLPPLDFNTLLRFNSKLVRLKGVVVLQVSGEKSAGFNSKLVRLKVMLPPLDFNTLLRFNSKLVRLKVHSEICLQTSIPFQFQTGSIKRGNGGLRKPTSQGFNSKLVRLKATVTSIELVNLMVFQFQTGSIKRPFVFYSLFFSAQFQFQTGSIKRKKKRSRLFR